MTERKLHSIKVILLLFQSSSSEIFASGPRVDLDVDRIRFSRESGDQGHIGLQLVCLPLQETWRIRPATPRLDGMGGHRRVACADSRPCNRRRHGPTQT